MKTQKQIRTKFQTRKQTQSKTQSQKQTRARAKNKKEIDDDYDEDPFDVDNEFERSMHEIDDQLKRKKFVSKSLEKVSAIKSFVRIYPNGEVKCVTIKRT
jgi:hypothetical protein